MNPRALSGKKKLSIFATFSFLSFLSLGLAQAVEINTTLPGAPPFQNNPGAWVGGFYQFSLMAAGLLAFGMIVYAGLRHTFAAGNPSTQSDARDQILQALLGLLLLLGAFIVLTTINPGLVNLQLPTLGKIQNTTSPSASNIFFKCNIGGSTGCFSSINTCNASCVGQAGAVCNQVQQSQC